MLIIKVNQILILKKYFFTLTLKNQMQLRKLSYII